MNRESYKSKRKPQPKGANNQSKSAPVETTEKVIDTPKLREIYNTQTEWATKLLPKLKEKTE